MTRFFDDWNLFEKSLLIGATSIMMVLSWHWGDTPVGMVSTFTGILAVILCAKGKISNFTFGCVYVLTYAWICYENGFYGQMALNALYYFPMNIVGFVMWRKNQCQTGEKLVTRHLTQRGLMFTSVGGGVAVVALFLGLQLVGGSLAFLDSLTTVAALIAMYFQVMRYTESWVMWIILNVISIALWLIAMMTEGSANISMLIMWSAYLINSIYGYINWRKMESIETQPA